MSHDLKKPSPLLSALALFTSFLPTNAETIVISDPGYFESPIRDEMPIFRDSLCFDSEAEELTFPDMGTFVCLGNYNFPNLRKVTLGSMDYMPAASFKGMPKLEEVVIDGLVGHFDCLFTMDCPNLKRIIFRGPVSSTGGSGFHSRCPQLENVTFESIVCDFGLEPRPNETDPKLKAFTITGGVLNSSNDSLTKVITAAELKDNPKLIRDMKTLARWQAEVLTAKSNKWMRSCTYEDARILLPVLSQLGSKEAVALKKAMEYAWNLGDDVKTDLEILKESPSYSQDSMRKEQFFYAPSSDSLLSHSREKFGLDSIAGKGTDIQRIKNLLYWVHNNITHDGNNGLPQGAKTLENIYTSSHRDSCGYNCRALAIALTEALLAEGIPARYLTCQSKKWETDNDCHVICVAWSHSLKKWIWVDPTFAAYITDENGLLLHPGEVRYRLQHDMPLILNSDANWNNKYPETKESYLDEYMAKNLYIMSANLYNRFNPEGPTAQQTKFAALTPQDSDYNQAHIITTDEDWFWQTPE